MPDVPKKVHKKRPKLNMNSKSTRLYVKAGRRVRKIAKTPNRVGWLEQITGARSVKVSRSKDKDVPRKDKNMEAARVGTVLAAPSKKEKKIFKGRQDHATDYEVQERLVWLSAQIRQGRAVFETLAEFSEKYNVSRAQAQSYMKRVWLEFKEAYGEADRKALIWEQAERLKDFAMRSGKFGDFKAAEALLRQYAEITGLLDYGRQTVVNVDNSQKVNIKEMSLAQMTLKDLENMADADLLGNQGATRQLTQEGSSGVFRSQEKDAVCDPLSHNNQG